VETDADRRSRMRLAAFMGTAGVMHFVRPHFYDPLIPGWLGRPRAWTYGSGVAELAAAALLMPERTRRLGAWWTVAVLIGVFPGNLKPALEGGVESAPGVLGTPVAAWLRLPLQVPLVRWAWRHTQ
jgi:uncharacterized membrane protein